MVVCLCVDDVVPVVQRESQLTLEDDRTTFSCSLRLGITHDGNNHVEKEDDDNEASECIEEVQHIELISVVIRPERLVISITKQEIDDIESCAPCIPVLNAILSVTPHMTVEVFLATILSKKIRDENCGVRYLLGRVCMVQ